VPEREVVRMVSARARERVGVARERDVEERAANRDDRERGGGSAPRGTRSADRATVTGRGAPEASFFVQNAPQTKRRPYAVVSTEPSTIPMSGMSASGHRRRGATSAPPPSRRSRPSARARPSTRSR
jgi:hypothetical protein